MIDGLWIIDFYSEMKTAWLKLVIFAGVTLAGLRERCRVADQTTLHV